MQSGEHPVIERKCVGAGFLAGAAREVFNHYCRPDPRYAVGLVESIYFDDAWLSSYWEKANGDLVKRKVRLRWYPIGSTPSAAYDGPLYLEIKDRDGATRRKFHRRVLSGLDDIARMPLEEDGLARNLYAAAAETGVCLPAGLMPTVKIRYKRCRYLCPITGTRACVDSEIHLTGFNRTRFEPLRPVECEHTVCEAKDNGRALHLWDHALFRMGFRSQSFSKYGFFVEKLVE